MTDADHSGILRRIRRTADLSQRELAVRIGISKSAVAAAESGRSGIDARALVRAAEVAGLRLALVDADGREVAGMDGDAVRDQAGRRYPAHLDTRYGDEEWWYTHQGHGHDREQPWYTLDRSRWIRDRVRARDGVPEDHQVPRPGDSPGQRAEARRAAHWRAVAAERQRRFLAGEFAHVDDGLTCACPPGCDEVDDGSGPPRHAVDCPCGCDLA
ncbi:helix-turn-helix domain-containing protein [Geodermatophilus poikilotrophus]|uniref:HTH-type transcriptional regulator / antitoxin HipB n=1 Tax=Geodermatophilus poikilotrophus TaxID=1333667 RepID=A0A1I0F5A7_9ACTN|nr:helix-turn-helix transcriptional regulator [Geodermatophilus poikilotrophus]SET53220.1 HTH-type transcriptional regulator / antitoxin HipB [Geodermatophilus poikilotrophus]